MLDLFHKSITKKDHHRGGMGLSGGFGLGGGAGFGPGGPPLIPIASSIVQSGVNAFIQLSLRFKFQSLCP